MASGTTSSSTAFSRGAAPPPHQFGTGAKTMDEPGTRRTILNGPVPTKLSECCHQRCSPPAWMTC